MNRSIEIDSEVDSEIDSEVDSELDSEIDSEMDSEIDNETDSEIDTDEIDSDIDLVVRSLDRSIVRSTARSIVSWKVRPPVRSIVLDSEIEPASELRRMGSTTVTSSAPSPRYLRWATWRHALCSTCPARGSGTLP